MSESNYNRNIGKHDSYRSGPSSPHKTSFKIGKPKASKVKVLTKGELIGMVSSALLSVVIAMILVFAGIKGTPIVMNNLLYFFTDVTGIEMTKSNNRVASTLSKANVLAVERNISSKHFTSKFYGKNAGIFDFALSLESCMEFLESRQSEPLVLKSTSIFNDDTYRVSINDILRGEMVVSDGHYLAEVDLETSTCEATACPWSNEIVNIPIMSDFQDKSTLVLGRNDSILKGPGFHADRQFVSLLLRGTKHWYIYKPNKVPSIGIPVDKNIESWLDTAYPLLSIGDMPVEILQTAGQVVYIPEGWYHATVTTSDVSASLQKYTSQEDRNSYYHYLRVGRSRFNDGDYTGANKMFKLGLALNRDAGLLYHFALSLERVGLYAQARDALYEMITRNKRDPTGYVKLINLMVTHFSDASDVTSDSPVSVPNLLEMAEQNHIREIVLLQSQDSL